MMTFAQELDHALHVEPILALAPPPPKPAADAPYQEWVAWRRAMAAWDQTRIPKPRETAFRALGIEEGFDTLLATARAKDLFNRFAWTEMNLPGETDEAQLREWLRRKCPDPAQATILTQGTFCRVLVRTHPMVVWSWLSVGSGLSPLAVRLEIYRALFDVGVRQIHHLIHPDNPYSGALLARGDYAYTPEGQYLHGVMVMEARP